MTVLFIYFNDCLNKFKYIKIYDYTNKIDKLDI